MGRKVNLTDRTLRSLKRNRALEDALGFYDTWDVKTPGLGVRISPKGRKTFVLMARYPGSTNPTRRSLGVYGALSLEQARKKAEKWLEWIGQGIDPANAEEEARRAELRKQATTFAAVAEDYLRLQVWGPDPEKPRQRRAIQVDRDFRRVFMAMWGERPITGISHGDILSLIEGVRDHGTAATLAAYGKGAKADKKPAPAQARNLLAELKTFFAWAIERRTYGLESSPCTFIRSARIIGERRSEDRILSDAELFAFSRAIEQLPYPYGPIYRLLILTGLRLNEAADASWDEFDLPNKIWTIPATRMKGKNGKARPHSVPLTADILAILNELPRFDGGNYLFSVTNGRSPVYLGHAHKRQLDALMLRTLKALAHERGEDSARVKLAPFVNHDLRRTLRSRLSELRVSVDVAEAILAHVKPGIRGVYDRYEHFDEKRAALELWGTKLRSIAEPTNVVAGRA
jgi:integrase